MSAAASRIPRYESILGDIMVRNGTRRCDLCASEILGQGGADICVVCRISMEEDPDYELQARRELEALTQEEGFALTAVVGRLDLPADEVVAANDNLESRPAVAHEHRERSARRLNGTERMVHRFAAGLRSFSRRRPHPETR